jgi:putrescine transport system ATP-binding protein
LATRIGVMNNGDIVQTAEPHEVYEYPQNRFVAEFIGNVNLFDGTVIDDERDSTSMRSADIDGLLQVDHGISCAPNQDVSVAIRPEKIRISREPIDLEVNATTGVISDVAYMGSQSIFKVRLNSGKEIRITQPNVSREMGNRLTWEDRVFLSWDADSCVVLVA